ncbi:MAG: efflux RND transporter periplasmic adaptor subunit [Gemmatimonadota bacterium]|jgi:HlyD family secretion protein|nr:efflux RND transporter periplasmic adaptor subunit [Gemmatimonadota bacterium]
MSKRMKWSLAGGAVLVVVLIAVAVGSKRGPKAVDVRVDAVQARDLVASVTASGQIQPRTKVAVSAEVQGRIVRLPVKEGDLVKVGQLVVQLDPQQFEGAVARAEASVAAGKAQLAQARANFLNADRQYVRSAEIRKQNPALLSEDQVENLRTQMEVNKALLEAAQQQLEQALAGLKDARWQLSRTTIYAPMSGKITRLNVELGETAVPGTFNKDLGTLLTVSDMSVLETKVKVDETDVARIAIGDSAQVQIDAFPDTTFVGKVVKISNSSVKGASTTSASDQAIDYEVTIQLLNPPTETRPDFSATAKIITARRQQVLSIPIIALTVRENEELQKGDTAVGLGKAAPAKQVGRKDVEGVFVVGADAKVTFRPVKVGIAGEKYFEVVSGLKSGERIVAGSYQAIRELKDGALIKAQDEAAKGGKKPAGTGS